MLILVGAGIIVFESTRRLFAGLGGRVARLRHRRDRVLGGRELRRVHLPLPPGARHRLARPRGRRRAPAHRRHDLDRRAGRAGARRDHGHRGARRDHGAAGGGGDRLRGRADPQPLVARARGRGAARRRARGRARGRSRTTARRRSSASTSCARAARAAAATWTCTCSSATGPRSSARTSVSPRAPGARSARACAAPTC